MTTDVDSDIASFIQEAELAPVDGHPGFAEGELPKITGENYEAAVVDSNLVTFDKKLPKAVRDHVANWQLLAQRVATDRAPGEDQVKEWTETYYEVLQKTGWVKAESATAWVEENAYGFTMHKKILAFVTSLFAPGATALVIITAAITSLQQMNENSPWITLFDRRGRHAKAVGFSVASCEPDQSAVSLAAVDFLVEAEQTMTQVLFFKFTSRTAKMYRRKITLRLSDEVMARHGQAVADKVHSLIDDSIAAYEVKPISKKK